MRILNKTEFFKLPPNTLFSKYQPCCFDDLCIKMESLDYDFYCQQLHDAIDTTDGDFTTVCDQAERTGASLNLDLGCVGRDGMFDDDQLFAVWEPKDVRALIARLSMCLPKA